jgi:GNAT superfamily N-acetyltransferase
LSAIALDGGTKEETLAKGYVPTVPGDEEDYLYDYAREQLREGEITLLGLFAENGATLASSIMFRHETEAETHINTLATLSQYKGQGFAGHLLDLAELAAKSEGSTKVKLTAHATSEKFYEYRGYTTNNCDSYMTKPLKLTS